jgi:Flp pilus assembly protein protease CpaA
MILSIISIIALLYGSYTDIKTREIPDTLSLGLIYLGVAISICASILFWSFKPMLSSLAGLAAGTIFGLAFYYTGQWGGGDAKMLMGLGSMIGLDFFALSSGFPEFGIFVINLLVFGAIYGVLWLLGLAIKDWKKFRPEFRKTRRRANIIKMRLFFLGLIILFAFVSLIIKPDFMLIAMIYVLLFFIVLSMYIFLIIRTVEKTSLLKKIETKNLTEGDWVLDKVKLKDADKYIYTKTGITEKGIRMLRKSTIKSVLVKEGIPFVPSFLIAYIFTIILGNWMLVIRF